MQFYKILNRMKKVYYRIKSGLQLVTLNTDLESNIQFHVVDLGES